MLRGTTDRSSSGAIGNEFGNVPNVCSAQDREVITTGSLLDADGIAAWSAFNSDTTGLAEHANHILGRTSLEFDKVNGLANTVYAGIVRMGIDLDLSRFLADDLVQATFIVSDKTNIVSVRVRLGTDASHFNEWVILNAAITQAIWQEMRAKLSECTIAVTGDGWDPAHVKYCAFLVEFDLETRALADIRLDHLMLKSVSPAS